MNDVSSVSGGTSTSRTGGRSRLKRRAATLAARCAMGSWLLLAAMPVVVLVCALN